MGHGFFDRNARQRTVLGGAGHADIAVRYDADHDAVAVDHGHEPAIVFPHGLDDRVQVAVWSTRCDGRVHHFLDDHGSLLKSLRWFATVVPPENVVRPGYGGVSPGTTVGKPAQSIGQPAKTRAEC
jgi:hypothetical protein